MDLIRVDLSRRARAAAAVLAAAAALLARPPAAAAQELGLAVGTQAPAAAVQTLDGKPADLAHLAAGAPTLIEFWATWCPNCKQLEPQVTALARRYGARLRLVTVAVSVNQTPERVRRYVAAHGIPGTVVFDAAGKATGAYDAPATSYVVLLDKAGRVTYTGQGGEQQLDPAVRRAVGQ